MLKNKIAVFFYVIVLLIFLISIIVYVNNGIKISRLNNMYKDIEILDEKIALYYLDNENLPITNNKINDFKENSTNPNDNDTYYEIDLNKLENLQLSFGNEILSKKDKYIINEQSHTVYYYDGIEYNGKKIYTKQVEYKFVELENYE